MPYTANDFPIPQALLQFDPNKTGPSPVDNNFSLTSEYLAYIANLSGNGGGGGLGSISVSQNGIGAINATGINFNNSESVLISVETGVDGNANVSFLSFGGAAYDQANNAYNVANLAYESSNTRLSANGGTIYGDLSIQGNLYLTGNTTLVNATSLNITDPIIYLASNNDVSDLVDIGFVGGKNTGTYSHTGLIRHAADDKYYLFDGYAEEPSNNVIDVTQTYLATLRANIEANSITLMGNVVATQANLNLAYNQANSAYNQANSAYNQANSAYNLIPSGTSDGQLITYNGSSWTANSIIRNVSMRKYTERYKTHNVNLSTWIIDCSEYNTHILNLQNSITDLGFSSVPSGGVMFTLTLVFPDPLTYVVVWGNNIKWRNGRTPIFGTASGITNIVVLTTFDGGTTWLGTPADNYRVVV